ncbi:hypothetical protein ACWCW7_02900 [Nocardia tengchongensis]
MASEEVSAMGIVAWARSTAAFPMLAAAAMVLILTGLATAFVYGAVPAVAGPATHAPAATQVRIEPPAPLPVCTEPTEITEDSPNPGCPTLDDSAAP